MKKLAFYFALALLVAVTCFRPINVKAQSLQQIQKCLPHPSFRVQPYMSIAKIIEQSGTEVSKWVLIRVNGVPKPDYRYTEEYSVIALRRDNKCINYNPISRFEPFTPLVRKNLSTQNLSQFQKIIDADTKLRDTQEDAMIRRKYPGKTIKDKDRLFPGDIL